MLLLLIFTESLENFGVKKIFRRRQHLSNFEARNQRVSENLIKLCLNFIEESSNIPWLSLNLFIMKSRKWQRKLKKVNPTASENLVML